MPRTAQEITDLLDIERIDDDLFRGSHENTSNSMRRVFGGQVAGQALVAAARTTPGDYVIHSLHSYFLRPGDVAVPIVYDVSDIRQGRSFATRRIAARQHGQPIFFMTADFQRPEDGFDHQDPMPAVVGPADAVPIVEFLRIPDPEATLWSTEWGALEIRVVPPERATAARSRLWMRIAGRLPDDPVTQAAAFTYASDLTLLGSTLVPHRELIGSPRVQAASLDHTIWFHRPFRADEWWLYDQESPSASGGRGLAIARVFAEDGRLVASVAQEGLIRRLDPGSSR